MKSIVHYINQIFESDVDETLDSFILLCKYADYFNSIEQHWHTVNKSTPNSRAIKDETDRLFKIANKSVTMVYTIPNTDYETKIDAFYDNYFEDDELRGKKLATIIRRTDEWKTFYKSYKKFKDEDILKGYEQDGQLKNFMLQFIQISVDFVDDIQT